MDIQKIEAALAGKTIPEQIAILEEEILHHQEKDLYSLLILDKWKRQKLEEIEENRKTQIQTKTQSQIQKNLPVMSFRQAQTLHSFAEAQWKEYQENTRQFKTQLEEILQQTKQCLEQFPKYQITLPIAEPPPTTLKLPEPKPVCIELNKLNFHIASRRISKARELADHIIDTYVHELLQKEDQDLFCSLLGKLVNLEGEYAQNNNMQESYRDLQQSLEQATKEKEALQQKNIELQKEMQDLSSSGQKIQKYREMLETVLAYIYLEGKLLDESRKNIERAIEDFKVHSPQANFAMLFVIKNAIAEKLEECIKPYEKLRI